MIHEFATECYVVTESVCGLQDGVDLALVVDAPTLEARPQEPHRQSLYAELAGPANQSAVPVELHQRAPRIVGQPSSGNGARRRAWPLSAPANSDNQPLWRPDSVGAGDQPAHWNEPAVLLARGPGFGRKQKGRTRPTGWLPSSSNGSSVWAAARMHRFRRRCRGSPTCRVRAATAHAMASEDPNRDWQV